MEFLDRRRKKNIAAAMMIKTTTPPTTPPAMAPVWLTGFEGTGVAEGDFCVDVPVGEGDVVVEVEVVAFAFVNLPLFNMKPCFSLQHVLI